MLPSQVQAAPDPVARVIAAARAGGAITASEHRQYAGAWRSSGTTLNRLTRARKSGRAAEVAAVRRITTGMARRGKLTPARLPAAMANVRATTYWFSSRGLPRHEQRVQVPFDEVVFGYYKGNGLQFQPLFTMAHGNQLYDTRQNDRLLRLVQRLERLSVRRGSYRTWEYYFPYAGGSAPWVSGMAQATAMQLLTRASERTGDPRWLALAGEGLPGFALPARNGGLAASVANGRWYLLYSFNPRQRILNGHLQVLLGLGDYAKASKNPDAQARVDEGVRSAVALLPRFDTGAWSNYQPGQEADVEYHELMTLQLFRLGVRTGRSEFSDMSNRFATYQETPPQLTVPVQPLPAMYPYAADGFRDAVSLRYFVDKRSTISASIVDQNGKVVRSLGAVSTGRGFRTLTWNGRTNGGRLVAPGGYMVRFRAVDIVGNQADGQFTEQLVTRRDTTPPQVTRVTVKAAGARATRVVVRGRDSESPYLSVQVRAPGAVVVARGRGKVVLSVPAARATVLKGRLIVRDSSGNRTRISL